VDGKLLIKQQGKGEFWLNWSNSILTKDRPRWSDIPGRWCRMRNLIR
jgi:hypothetical protein